jgi:hypothetical protein
MPDAAMRPEVLACQERAESLRVEAEEVADAAIFWALLDDHQHGNGEGCDDSSCYEAWKAYPDG